MNSSRSVSGAKAKKTKSDSDVKLILTTNQKRDLLEAFKLLDKEGSGLIKGREIKVALRALGFDPTAADIRQMTLQYDPENKGEDITDEELQEMIDEADKDGDGEVSEEEFLWIMRKTNIF
ncbi:unnamed protein product [Heterobilharzia americana]|nr:unnamed protein product [Heterobilharzia americana]